MFCFKGQWHKQHPKSIAASSHFAVSDMTTGFSLFFKNRLHATVTTAKQDSRKQQRISVFAYLHVCQYTDKAEQHRRIKMETKHHHTAKLLASTS